LGRELAERMGGSLVLEDPEPAAREGATFALVLPTAPAAPEPERASTLQA
jgi:signal transduction histidine kinase